ncbi:MAG: leucyl/phenylalanyl-tRNA--protein transferase [Phycisphaerales bacterium]|nr:leucyl/phenylalanyl-tRNA--protein transferase [Phycisphaerales bacterium]
MSAPHTSILIESFLAAYREGWFPMGDPRTGRVEWVQPRRRAIIPLDPAPRFSRSLRAKARRNHFLITTDTAFEHVIRACAAPSPLPGRDFTWIDPSILDAFLRLHRAGHAHSIEVWLASAPGGTGVPPVPDVAPPITAAPSPAPGQSEPRLGAGKASDSSPRLSTSPAHPPTLLGGLYGLAIGRAFMGESMFCRPDLGGTDASKLALLHLAHHLRRRGFTLLDSQIQNPHMKSLGALEIPRATYLKRVAIATGEPPPGWLPFEPTLTAASLGQP